MATATKAKAKESTKSEPKQLPKEFKAATAGGGTFGVARPAVKGTTPIMLKVLTALKQLGATNAATAVGSAAVVAKGFTATQVRHNCYNAQTIGLAVVAKKPGATGYVFWLTPAGATSLKAKGGK